MADGDGEVGRDPIPRTPFVERECDVGGCACGIWEDWQMARHEWARRLPEAALLDAIEDDDERLEAVEDLAEERDAEFEHLAPPCPYPGCARYAPYHDFAVELAAGGPWADLDERLRAADCRDAEVVDGVEGAGAVRLVFSRPGADAAAAAAGAVRRLREAGLVTGTVETL